MCTNSLIYFVVSLLSMCRARALSSSHIRSSAFGVHMNAQNLHTCGNSGFCEQFLKCLRHQAQLEGCDAGTRLLAPSIWNWERGLHHD